jgi:hypothetical protein
VRAAAALDVHAMGIRASLLLRTAWLGWLTSLLGLCAWPALVMQLPGIDDSVVIARGAAGICVQPDCAPEPWLITDVSWPWQNTDIVLALTAGAVLPSFARGATEKFVVAMSLGLWAFLDLSEPRFIKNYGCMVERTFAVPEYLAYVAVLLIVILLHAPARALRGERLLNQGKDISRDLVETRRRVELSADRQGRWLG